MLLTDQRLLFYQIPTLQFEVPLGHIKGLKAGRFYYAMKDRDALGVCYDGGRGASKGEVWFIVNHVENWKKKIYQVSLLKINKGAIEEISAQLDSDGQDILWFMWENRHARINQLADLIDAPNHTHVLLIIKETVNPVGQKVVGCPVLSFERSKLDPETGELILFSWWLVGQLDRCVPSEERLLDIFDEDSHIQVIMEVRGIHISDVRLDYTRDVLTVRSHKIGSSLREIFGLPAQVTLDNHEIFLKNNLLEIRLPKVPAHLA